MKIAENDEDNMRDSNKIPSNVSKDNNKSIRNSLRSAKQQSNIVKNKSMSTNKSKSINKHKYKSNISKIGKINDNENNEDDNDDNDISKLEKAVYSLDS